MSKGTPEYTNAEVVSAGVAIDWVANSKNKESLVKMSVYIPKILFRANLLFYHKYSAERRAKSSWYTFNILPKSSIPLYLVITFSLC